MNRQTGAVRKLTLNLTTHPTGSTFGFNAFQSAEGQELQTERQPIHPMLMAVESGLPRCG